MPTSSETYPQSIASDERIILKKVNVSPIDGTKAYAKLRNQITKAGVLDRAYGYYALLAIFILGGFALSLYYVITLPTSWPLLFWATTLSFFTVQFGGFLHDGAHRAIFTSTTYNDWVGHFFGTLLVIGYPAWRTTHNAHHASTNIEDEDPDLETPLHNFTVKRFQSEKGAWKLLRNHQAFVFFPLRTLVVYTLRLRSIAYFRSQPFSLWLLTEIILWLAGLAAWLVVPFFIFPPEKAILLFVFVNTLMGIYISNVFAPNHKGMPQIKKGTKISFLEHQILTSRNIKGNWFVDFIYFGLNYQIEHHLFPNCPRNKLKRITPYLLAICKELNITYTAAGLWESNKIIVRELNRVVTTAKESEKAVQKAAPKTLRKRANPTINYAAYLFRSSMLHYLLLFISWFTGRK